MEFQFLSDARRLHHAGQHGVHPFTRRPVNLQQVWVQLFTQDQANGNALSDCFTNHDKKHDQEVT